MDPYFTPKNEKNFWDPVDSYDEDQFGGITPYSPSPVGSSPTKPYVDPLEEQRRHGLAEARKPQNIQTPTSSYSGGQASSIPYGKTSTWKPSPDVPMPTMGELPDYESPEFDEDRVSELTELGMGSQLGRLRRGLGMGMQEARYSDNPMVRAESRRRVLEGYGTGLADARTGAHKSAMSEYAPEYQASLSKAQAEYQAKLNKINVEYQTGLQKYFSSGSQTTTPTRNTNLGTSSFFGDKQLFGSNTTTLGGQSLRGDAYNKKRSLWLDRKK